MQSPRVTMAAQRNGAIFPTSRTSSTPATANQTTGGCQYWQSNVNSRMPPSPPSTLTEYAKIPRGALSRYPPTICPSGTKIMAFKINSGTVIEIAAVNASNASPDTATAEIPMELTPQATPKYDGSALINSRIGRHGN